MKKNCCPSNPPENPPTAASLYETGNTGSLRRDVLALFTTFQPIHATVASSNIPPSHQPRRSRRASSKRRNTFADSVSVNPMVLTCFQFVQRPPWLQGNFATSKIEAMDESSQVRSEGTRGIKKKIPPYPH